MMLSHKEFDALETRIAQRRVSIARATPNHLATIYPTVAAAFMQHMASLETCESIRARHVDNFWAILGRRGEGLIGMYAMVMLTRDGLAAVQSGRFEAHDPRLSHVAATGSTPAAIYKWGVYAPGIAAAAIALVADVLSQPEYRALDLYGNGTTEAGQRIMRSVGFRCVDDPRTPNLFFYQRLCNRRRSVPIPDPRTGHDL